MLFLPILPLLSFRLLSVPLHCFQALRCTPRHLLIWQLILQFPFAVPFVFVPFPGSSVFGAKPQQITQPRPSRGLSRGRRPGLWCRASLGREMDGVDNRHGNEAEIIRGLGSSLGIAVIRGNACN